MSTKIKRISPKRWIYWGHETIYPEWERCGTFEQFYWVEDVYPFRMGNGWRWKETPFKAFHFGFAKSVEGLDSQEKVIGSRDLDSFSAEEIGEWDGTKVQAQGKEAGPSEDDHIRAVGEDAHGGLVPSS